MFMKLLLGAMIATTLAFAQGGGGMGDDMGGTGGRGGGGGDDMGEVRMQRQSPFDIFADRLKLTKDQKTEALAVVADALKESGPVRQQLMQAKLDLAKAMLSGASADDLKKTNDTYASLAAQMTGIETKAFAKVCATLKPNQQGRAASAFELMAGMFNATAGGGGGRRGGGRGERN